MEPLKRARKLYDKSKVRFEILKNEIEEKSLSFIEDIRNKDDTKQMTSKYIINKKDASIYLRYSKTRQYKKDELYKIGLDKISDYAVIANVELNQKWRGNGWFWNYVNFLNSNLSGGVFVERASFYLYDSLVKRSNDFTQITDNTFYTKSNILTKNGLPRIQ